MMLFLVLETADDEFFDCAFRFRSACSAKLVGAVDLVEGDEPLSGDVGKQVVEAVTCDEDVVRREGKHHLVVRPAGV